MNSNNTTRANEALHRTENPIRSIAACELDRYVQKRGQPGVYFLLEKQTAETGDRAYIGESENVVKRISQQDKNQDFWNEVIIFTSKDENLTKGHIKYLESRLTNISI